VTSSNRPTTSFRANADFLATRWSVVLAAGGDQASSRTRQALEQLIRAYWFPLYAYLRRQGRPAGQAEDLVQEFLMRLLERKDLARVDRAKGRFRSFLLACLKHFLANEHDKAQALKRGGGVRVIALDALDAEARYALEPADKMTPERLFDRRWALAVLDQVLNRLREEYVSAGKEPFYETVKDCLVPDRDRLSYSQIAQRLAMTPGALKVAVHRMRRRYRELLRDEIAQTVDSPGQIDDEIAYLLNCL
jgi:RNA polymerase sigma-70 factor (ECF subfamily)